MIEIPPVPVLALMIFAMGASVVFALFASERFKATTQLGFGRGLDAWALVHEIPEILLAFLVVVSMPLLMTFCVGFYPYFVGLLILGSSAMLYLMLKHLRVEKALSLTFILTASPIALLIFLWPVSPLVASLIAYLPVIAAFLVPAYWMWRISPWVTAGLVITGLGHELFEAFVLHPIGWTIFIEGGTSTPQIPEVVFILFVIFQVVGPLILALMPRKASS